MASAKNKRLGTYPGILITVSLCLALFLIGFCGWVALSSKQLVKYVRENVEVQIYLDREVSPEQATLIEAELRTFDAISENKEGIKSIVFISRADAAKKFVEETNEEYNEILGDNPFRDAFSIKLKEQMLEGNALGELKTKVENIEGVFELDYAEDFVQGIISNANKAYLILSSIVLIFLIATLILINNTIKLALYSQRFIIRTMQLIGATNSFIQKPFVKKGLLQGAIAALISIGLLFGTQQLAVNQVEGLALIQNNQMIYILGAFLMVLGPLIGVLSTLQSVTRYLNIDLDDLY